MWLCSLFDSLGVLKRFDKLPYINVIGYNILYCQFKERERKRGSKTFVSDIWGRPKCLCLKLGAAILGRRQNGSPTTTTSKYWDSMMMMMCPRSAHICAYVCNMSFQLTTNVTLNVFNCQLHNGSFELCIRNDITIVYCGFYPQNEERETETDRDYTCAIVSVCVVC